MSLQSFRSIINLNHIILKVVNRQLIFRPLAISPTCYPLQSPSITRSLSTEAKSYTIEKEGLLDGLKRRCRLQFRKYKLRRAGFHLYECIADNIDYEDFTNELNLPDTFNTWFMITELHVWMLMSRLMVDPIEGRFVRNCLVEALWQDVTTRTKKLGSEHASIVRKQVHILNEEFQAALVNYDEGLLSNDKILLNAVWRRLYEQNCDNAVLLEAMVKYIRQTMFLLDRINLEELLTKKTFKWIPLAKLFEDLPPK